ncbi:MAG: hypothetical protein ACXVNF_13265 [Neobacillus sp.]
MVSDIMGVSSKDMLLAIAEGEDDPEQVLKSALTEAAHSVVASKNYLGALYRRTLARKFRKRSAIVVAHAMLKIAFYFLTRKEMYVDLGEDYFDKQMQVSIVRHSVRRLESLGYTVTITEAS